MQLRGTDAFSRLVVWEPEMQNVPKMTFDVTPLLYFYQHLDHVGGCLGHPKTVIGQLNSIAQLL